MRVVADWRSPSLSQVLRICRVNEVIIGEVAAAAVVGQQAGRVDDARRRIGSQTVTMHGRQVVFAAVAIAVFESERAGVERQGVEMQRAGRAVGLDRQAGLLAASRRASSRLRAAVRTSVVPLLLRCPQQLNDRAKKQCVRRGLGR